MGLLDDLLRFISEGSIAGLPALVMLAIPFVLGLIVGVLAKKFLKIALIAGLIIAVVTYFGLFNLSLGGLKDVITQYGPTAIHVAVLLLGILPLSVGFLVGFFVAFFFL